MKFQSLRDSQKGMSLPLILLAVAVLVVVGVAAYRVGSNTLSSSSSNRQGVVSAPHTITTKADLRKANRALNTAPIGSDVNPNQLDGNIKSLL